MSGKAIKGIINDNNNQEWENISVKEIKSLTCMNSNKDPLKVIKAPHLYQQWLLFSKCSILKSQW